MADLKEIAKRSPFGGPIHPGSERRIAAASGESGLLVHLLKRLGLSFSVLFSLISCPTAVTKDEHSCEFGSMKYYALCGFGGILSCGLTHTAVVPLDLVKCRIQVSRAKVLKYS